MTTTKLPYLPEPEFSMVYFSYEGWHDWPVYDLSNLADRGNEIRTCYSRNQLVQHREEYARPAVGALKIMVNALENIGGEHVEGLEGIDAKLSTAHAAIALYDKKEG